VRLQDEFPCSFDGLRLLYLVRIRFESGRTEEAKAFLVDLMKTVWSQADNARGDAHELRSREESYRQHVRLLRKVFPDEASELLKKHEPPDIPAPKEPGKKPN
jgi:hypothetical protein